MPRGRGWHRVHEFAANRTVIGTRSSSCFVLLSLLRDERGGEVIEYALIAGLVIVGAIAVIGTVGGKVLARWTSVNGSL